MSNEPPPPNRFVLVARRVYHPLGFTKGYNFILFFIFAGALTGFCLARLQYLNFDGIFCGGGPNGAAPGECFYYGHGYERVGMILHLACILPAGLLVCLQFVPIVRHKALLFHRLNGYVVLVLALGGTLGALMVARHAFGGGLDTQAATGFGGIAFLGALALAYYNVKRLQLEQHRAWMLRAWFYATSIISLRFIVAIAALIVSNQGYYTAKPCAQLYFMIKNQTRTLELYPECAPFFAAGDLDSFEHWAVVPAILRGGNISTAASATGFAFGTAAWLALAIHMIGVELYLRLTPAETERLRNVSYQRQLEAGMKDPGRAGLTADRIGDSRKWSPTPRDGVAVEVVSVGDEEAK